MSTVIFYIWSPLDSAQSFFILLARKFCWKRRKVRRQPAVFVLPSNGTPYDLSHGNLGTHKVGRTAVEGKILNKFDMKPHNENIQNYGKLCRERTSKYMTKSRQIQVIDNDNGSHMRPMPGMVIASAVSVSMGMATSFFWDKKKMPTKGSDMKRTRRDRGEMEEILFKLFERQPNWTLRQLIQETDQPEVYAPQQFLKDLLKDLCVYNNKGTNQGTYELKPEYKRSGEESTPK
ncbi:Transcription initiation factor IIF subunit beta [Vitis vinifera]|uniref:Transcription initiation factor IIF subunit beta n=1 Tax=Vitis vinifera TaxID=29760 RepID=A0A438G5C4_VITVI|nr:Transcription initiation factor IIF subunit beta [Vitis vinifera]